MIEVSGQQIPLSISTTIAEAGGAWSATDVMTTPNGDVTTTSTLEKGTLINRKISMKSGQASVDLDFAGDKAAGNVNIGGQEKPVSVDLGGPLFANAAGAKQSISCLPLAEGYTTTYRNFDRAKADRKADAVESHGRGKSNRSCRNVRRLQGRNHFGRWRRGQGNTVGSEAIPASQ